MLLIPKCWEQTAKNGHPFHVNLASFQGHQVAFIGNRIKENNSFVLMVESLYG